MKKDNSTSQQTQPRADPDIDGESDTRRCPRCSESNKRKHQIGCAVCGSLWHINCVSPTRAQADTLGCWWCPVCIGASQSQPTKPSPVYPPRPSQSSLPQGPDFDLALCLAQLKKTRPVVRRVPRGARILAAESLSSLIQSAVRSGTAQGW